MVIWFDIWKRIKLSKYKEEFELIWASVGCVSSLRRKITLFKQYKKKTDVTRLTTYAHDSRKRFQINPFFKILLNLAMGKEFSIWIGKSVCGLDGGKSFKVNYILLAPNYLAFRFEVFFLFCVHELYFHRYSVTFFWHNFYSFVSLI